MELAGEVIFLGGVFGCGNWWDRGEVVILVSRGLLSVLVMEEVWALVFVG